MGRGSLVSWPAGTEEGLECKAGTEQAIEMGLLSLFLHPASPFHSLGRSVESLWSSGCHPAPFTVARCTLNEPERRFETRPGGHGAPRWAHPSWAGSGAATLCSDPTDVTT